jgi:hypothetical protein
MTRAQTILRHHHAVVDALALDPTGARLVTGDWGGMLTAWSLDPIAPVWSVSAPHPDHARVAGLHWLDADTFLAVRHTYVERWRVGASAPDATFAATAQYWSHATALSPGHRWLAVPSARNGYTVDVWDLLAPTAPRVAKAGGQRVGLAFTDDDTLWFNGEGGVARCWRMGDPAPVRCAEAVAHPMVVSANRGGRLAVLWHPSRTATTERLSVLDTPQGPSIASRDGLHVDATVRLDPSGERVAWSEREHPPGHAAWVHVASVRDLDHPLWRARLPLQALTLAWSHDGRVLYAGCADKTVRVFRLPDAATST